MVTRNIIIIFRVTPWILQHLNTLFALILLMQFHFCSVSYGNVRLPCQESTHFPCTPVSVAVWIENVMSLLAGLKSLVVNGVIELSDDWRVFTWCRTCEWFHHRLILNILVLDFLLILIRFEFYLRRFEDWFIQRVLHWLLIQILFVMMMNISNMIFDLGLMH